ncbi:MAG: primosomal protein N' [Bacteroidia bacterium]
MITLFADVVLPLALPKVYTYRIPLSLNDEAARFCRVIVPVGKKKRYSGIIWNIHDKAPEGRDARYIEAILDDAPLLDENHARFWEWMATYYMCSLGEVMNAALPSGLKLSSETIIQPVTPDSETDLSDLSDREFLILDALKQTGELNLEEVSKIAGVKTVFPIIQKLAEKNLITTDEELKFAFKPKTEQYLALHPDYAYEDALNALINSLKRAPKQQDCILAFLQDEQNPNINLEPKKRSELLKKNVSAAALSQLIKKDVFVLELRSISRLEASNAELALPELSHTQTKALNDINKGIGLQKPVLLHGYTGSGKTELYIHLMEEAISAGKQVLYLLPEIALTAQIVRRLRAHFGGKAQTYHSKFSENERMEVWQAVERKNEEGSLVIGARSALFLPFQHLGLIIVDEEHDSSYKQSDPAPRYHARDAALMKAKIYKCPIILGSATPSVESYYHAISSKYHLVGLYERFGGAILPEIIIADLKEATRKQRMKGIFSKLLLDEIETTHKQGKQSILFRNRRGFAPLLECNQCKWVPQCAQCDISLTYHKQAHQLKCHYCGYAIPVVSHCKDCNSGDIRMKGFGTERLEEELSSLLPSLSIGRMDLDTTRSKHGHYKIIEDFQEGRIEVLVGTQMVSKGLDFDHVKLAAVLNADTMLQYPDFRAFERSFQMLSQVCGRAGRRSEPGTALIQTWNPDHPVLGWVKNHDYKSFFAYEINERKTFEYPPFCRLIHIYVRHENQQMLDEGAELITSLLRTSFGKRILGPEYPPVGKVRNLFQKNIMIKLEITLSPSKAKSRIEETIRHFQNEVPLKGFRIIVDVDPI